MSVAVIVDEGMTAGYPLYTWAMKHRSRSMDSEGQVQINSQDPEDIMHELVSCTVQTRIAYFPFLRPPELHFHHAKIRKRIMPRAWQCSAD